jgi:hypothetical protein
MKHTSAFGAAALVLACALQAQAKAPQVYSYAITHPAYGAIGAFSRSSSSDSDGLVRADAHLRIVVRVLGVVVRRETSDQTEVWRGQRLISFRSLNSTNGKASTISGEASGAGFSVTTPSGNETGPAEIVASDPWSLNRLGSGSVVSTRTGKISAVQVTGGEVETVRLNGAPQSARHFHVNTLAQPNKWEVWIDASGVPIKFRSLETGGAIDFTLTAAPEPVH